MKMEEIECSETSAYKIQTPGNHPEENIQHVLSNLSQDHSLSFCLNMLLHLSDHINFENNFNMLLNVWHIVSFWLVQELAELVDGLNGCGGMAGGWCLVA
jgi:hypothetical protein